MKTKDVAMLSPQERFVYWIKERESIRLKKEAGKPKPWTDDSILQNNRFCNVRRMDDKVSQWILNNWYEPNFNHKNMVVACVLARHFNQPALLDVIGFPKRWNPDAMMKKIRAYQARPGKNLVFNGAYIIRASKDFKNKAEMVLYETCQQFIDNPLCIDLESLQSTTEALISYRNIGSFMAGQICSDMRWSIEGDWSDARVWAAMGPGSARGMNRYQNREVDSKLKQEQFLEEMLEVIKLASKKLPDKIKSRLEAIDWQNCFCEFDKYTRVLKSEGRTKSKYPGTSL